MKKIRFLSIIFCLLLIPQVVFSAIDRKEVERANRNFKNVKNSDAKLNDFSKKLYIVIDGIDVTKVIKKKPMAIKGKASIALRDFTERVGARLTWYEQYRMVGIEKDSSHILIPIDKEKIWVSGEIKDIDVPAKIDGPTSTTYIPLRTIAESLGYKVEFDTKEFKAILTSKK